MPNRGHFTIPTYIFLDLDQRHLLETLVFDHGVDLPTLLTELLAKYLAQHSGVPSTAAADAETPLSEAQRALVRQRRAELMRLRTQIASTEATPPDWVTQYVVDLEAELKSLERGV